MTSAFYGQAGTGKTTLAASFPPKVLFIDCSEKGTDSIRDIKGVDVIRAEDWDDVEGAYWYLRKEKHPYKTVVVDTMSQAQDLCIKSLKDIDPEEIGWGTMSRKDWGEVSTKLKTFIINMRDLDMNVVFIAHDKQFGGEEDEDDNEAIAPSVGPRLMPSVNSVLKGAVSIIGNTYIKKQVVKKKKGRKTVVVSEKIVYCLRIGPNATYATKIRKPKKIELPDIIVNPSFKKIMRIIEG